MSHCPIVTTHKVRQRKGREMNVINTQDMTGEYLLSSNITVDCGGEGGKTWLQ